jgi:hypothetical protein
LKGKLLISLFLAISLVFGCGGGGSSPSSGTTSSVKVPAENIVFSADVSAERSANAHRIYRAASGIDASTKILAQNVTVNNSNNSLASDNLQSALDDELAIDLAKLLDGSTWSVSNKSTVYPSYKDTMGVISFSQNTIEVASGKFAAAGLAGSAQITWCEETILTPISYEILSNSVLFVTYTSQMGDGNTSGRESIITVVARDKNTLTLVGQGFGCGINIPQLSILTKISAPESASLKNKNQTPAKGIRMILASETK